MKTLKLNMMNKYLLLICMLILWNFNTGFTMETAENLIKDNPDQIEHNETTNNWNITVDPCLTAASYGDVDDQYVTGSLTSGNAIWYSFHVPAGFTDDVVVSACYSNFDTQLAIFDDCSDYSSIPNTSQPPGSIYYNDDNCSYQSEITMQLPDTGMYYLVLWGYNYAPGYYDIEIYSTSSSVIICTADADFTNQQSSGLTWEFTSLVANVQAGYWVDWDFGDGYYDYDVDIAYHTYSSPGTYLVSCEAYDPLDSTCYDIASYSVEVSAVSGVNECATATDYGDVDDPYIDGTLPTNQYIWFSFDVPLSNTDDVDVTLCYSNFDTQLAIFDDCSDFSTLPEIGMPPGALYYNDDSCSYQSRIIMSVPDAGTYYALIWGYEFEGGLYDIEILSTASSTPVCTADADFSYVDNADLSVDFTTDVTFNTNDFTIVWDFGDGNSGNGNSSTNTYTMAGNYTVTCTVTDINDQTCYDVVTENILVTYSPAGAPWSVSITSLNHTILIPQSATITIDVNSLAEGDYLGVFYDSLGTLVCGGFTSYSSTGGNMFISAWGADLGNDGFDSGEEFTWKVYKNSSNEEFIATASYNTVDFSNSAYFSSNGLSGISSLVVTTSQTQNIVINQGWNNISTYINASYPVCDSIFYDIIADIIIVKDYLGMIYWPAWNINAIGDINIAEGYQVKAAQTQTLVVEGIAAIPENTPISLPSGWSSLGYLRQGAAPIVTMLSPIVQEIIIVKDELGMIYWPEWLIDAIINMSPGEGYQIKLNSPQILTFPANTSSFSKNLISPHRPVHFNNEINTGDNMTIGIPLSAWDTPPEPGDEIGVFNHKGRLIGAEVCGSNLTAITVWGDEIYKQSNTGSNGEFFYFKHWSMEKDLETNYSVKTWSEGESSYKSNAIYLVNTVSGYDNHNPESRLDQNTPNPFKSFTTIPFTLNDDGNVNIIIYNAIGDAIMELSSSNMPAGSHSFEIDGTTLCKGTYFYKLISNDFVAVKPMIKQ
jgi:hypothetical protein